ncbi:hypothetical protein BKP35_02575 [Anaerobacillus arseniciselenatis]|uniref:Uncharacterized protein n=1 Tax=Anaerobacillus arseniciselenatis TaxID=85682 RepID=A0A1S2LUQ5_9BACI|nr:hypothetical protein [Anaerobacillus arseniciselenatis]OIJ15893.1 hypothetical protein BKP35_02575 [Anaerobacillus arseniciselenatis]
MTSNFNEDQAEQLRKRIEKHDEKLEDQTEAVDVLSLPSRKEKFNKSKLESQPSRRQKKREKQTNTKKNKTKVKFPLVRILLFLFLVLVVLVTTYPKWIERLNL